MLRPLTPIFILVISCCSAAAADAPEDEDRLPPVEFQPESVAGEMREYQLEGLKWLVARFDDGINTILADEMVCRLGSGTQQRRFAPRPVRNVSKMKPVKSTCGRPRDRLHVAQQA